MINWFRKKKKQIPSPVPKSFKDHLIEIGFKTHKEYGFCLLVNDLCVEHIYGEWFTSEVFQVREATTQRYMFNITVKSSIEELDAFYKWLTKLKPTLIPRAESRCKSDG